MRRFRPSLALLVALLVAMPTVLFAQSLSMEDTVFQVDNPFYWHAGQYYKMDVSPVILNNRVYLPIRYISQALGCDIQWVPKDQSIIVSSQAAGTSQGQIITGGIYPEDSTGYDGYTMPVKVSVTGEQLITGSVDGILDTGSSTTVFPDDFLRRLGFQPIGGPITGGTTNGTGRGYYYKIPYPAIIQDRGLIPLGQGNIVVTGVVGARGALIGADILSHDHLILNDQTWTLTVPTR